MKVEPRSNNAIAAGLSSFAGVKHHQKLDVERHPEKAKGTTKKLRAKDRPLANDFVTDQEFDELLLAWFGNIARVLLPGRAAYVWGGYANCANYPPVLKATGLYFSQAIIWVKEHPVLTRKDFMGNHEWCFYCWREGAAHQFLGPANATDVWSVKKVNPQNMVHLTEKPVELAVRAIQYSSRSGENVLDLFGGSGSTLIGCEQTGRKAFLMELDPLYADVIVQKYEQFTGQKAIRQAVTNPDGIATTLIADLQNRISEAERRMPELAEEIAAAENDQLTREDVDAAFGDFDNLWDALSPREQSQLVGLLISQVGFDPEDNSIEMEFHPTAIKKLAQQMGVTA